MVARLQQQTGTEILNRIFENAPAPLKGEAAESILALRFSPTDRKRMQQLARKAQLGKLTDNERILAEEYNRISHLLALMHAKALVGSSL